MLLLKLNGAVVDQVIEGAAFLLPNGDTVSPAVAGWQNDEGFALVEMVAAETPAAPSVEDWRQGAYLARGAFVRALRDEGILPDGEAIAAARGEWPATFAAALALLPVDPVGAQIDWAAGSGVARLHPLFVALLGFYATQAGLQSGAAEALGDRIFGWIEPPAPAD